MPKVVHNTKSRCLGRAKFLNMQNNYMSYTGKGKLFIQRSVNSLGPRLTNVRNFLKSSIEDQESLCYPSFL